MSHKPKTTTTTTTMTTRPLSDRKIALCVGINDYPGASNDLNGCVNDAKAWAAILKNTYGFNVSMLIDKQATHANFTNILGNFIVNSKPGQQIVVTYSGHGTNVPDQNGDESDGRDEAICLYDSFLVDDAIRDLFKNINPDAILTFISDSCHSGTVTREFLTVMGQDNAPIPRYLPPKDSGEAFEIRATSVSRKIFYPEADMKEMLITGCLPNEYSYDAMIGNVYHGAMSYYAINVLKQFPTITYENFYAKLRQSLPSKAYPQTPQLEGSDENKKRIMFA